jgi:uncharacterized protein YcbK (DUF882 family)
LRFRRFGAHAVGRAAIGLLGLGFLAAATAQAAADIRSLNLYNIHTEERATIVFKRDGVYDQAGLQQINMFLRDWRRDEPTRMDPHLLDLVWEAYRESGSHDYIHVVSGYRSPTTNASLRRLSNGVAENSLHMAGKAMDFYLPDVKLARLREIGLTLQSGGVGYYPTSGAPFVHMDTGSVRHWPRMTRQQLVQVFPNGGTLHIPSDGNPLPGYQQALAAYNARKATGADIVPLRAVGPAISQPVAVASKGAVGAPMPLLSPGRETAIAVASYSPPPMPRLAPELATAAIPDAAPMALASATFAPSFDLAWSEPDVPDDLAEAMAALGIVHAPVQPISPTAVVATVDLDRSSRAAAITNAVLRDDQGSAGLPQLLAYAPLDPFLSPGSWSPSDDATTAAAAPGPAADAGQAPAVPPIEPTPRVYTPPLAMAALDTAGLRLWMGSGSTRQEAYALLTMPDLSQSSGLISKPDASFGTGFGRTASNLRTDHFTGPAAIRPLSVELAPARLVTASRF